MSSTRLLLLTLLVYGLTASAATDPIDRLVSSLPSNGLWINGLFPKITLPDTANPSQVVAACMVNAHIERYSILAVRNVTIAGVSERYVAALVDSNVGQKVVLLRYSSPDIGWWTRVYDAK